jgi:hypothetical protein
MKTIHFSGLPHFLFFFLTIISVSGKITVHVEDVGPLGPNLVVLPDRAVVTLSGYPGGTFFYTLDGSDATSNSIPYTNSIILEIGEHELRIINYSSDHSLEESSRYFISVRPSLTIQVNTPHRGLYSIVSAPPSVNGKYMSNSMISISAISGGGWTFRGWRDVFRSDADLLFTLKSNVFLRPIFDTTFSVTNTGPGTVTIESPKARYEYGDQVVIHAKANPGAYLKEWTNDFNNLSLKDPLIYTIVGPGHKVTGSFDIATLNQVTLELNSTGGGAMLYPEPLRYVFFAGEKVEINVETVNGTFSGWVGKTNPPTEKLSFFINEHTELTAITKRRLKWSVPLDNSGDGRPIAIGLERTIFATTSNHLFSIGTTGQINWALKKSGLSWPAIGPNTGSIYLTGPEGVLALTSTGDYRWHVAGGQNGVGIDAFENIYVNDGSELKSLTKDGVPRWKTTLAGVHGTPVVSKNRIVVIPGEIMGDLQEVKAFDQEGELVWENLKNPGHEISVGPDNLFYFGRLNELFAVAETGTPVWISPLGGHVGSATIDSSRFAYADFLNPLEVGLGIARISNDGSNSWTFIDTNLPPARPIIDEDNLLYSAGPLFRIFSSDQTLMEIGSVPVDAMAALGADATLYSASESMVYAVDAENDAAQNSWSTFRSNAQRTGSIIPENQSPSFPVIRDATSTNNVPFILTIMVSDDFSTPEQLVVNVHSHNQTLVADSNLVVSPHHGSLLLRTITITPNTGATGVVQITVTVTDGATPEITFSRDFLLTLQNPITIPGPQLKIDLVPALTLTGVVGQNYRIESRLKISEGPWTTLTHVTLTNQTQMVYFDTGVLDGFDRFYRAVLE